MSTARASISDFLSLPSTSLASASLCFSIMTCKPGLLAILTKSAMSFLVPITLPFTIFSSNVGKSVTLPRTPRTTMPPFLTDLMATSITLSDAQRQLHCQADPPPLSGSSRIAHPNLGRQWHCQHPHFLTSRYVFSFLMWLGLLRHKSWLSGLPSGQRRLFRRCQLSCLPPARLP